MPSIQLRSGGQAATEAYDGVRPTSAGGMPSASTGARSRADAAAPSRRGPYLFLLPSGLILLVFVVYPIAESLWMSLHNWSFFSSVQTFMGLQNYRTMVHDPRFWNALRNTAVYTVLVVPLQVGLGLALAVALQRNTFVNKFFRSRLLLTRSSRRWRRWGSSGNSSSTLRSGSSLTSSSVFGLPNIDFLESTTWALPAVMLVGVWKGVGFSMVIFLAALQDVPEAADRSGRARRRGSVVTVPSRCACRCFGQPCFLLQSSRRSPQCKLFDSIYVMTRGGPIFHTETIVYLHLLKPLLITSSPGTAPPSLGCFSC